MTVYPQVQFSSLYNTVFKGYICLLLCNDDVFYLFAYVFAKLTCV